MVKISVIGAGNVGSLAAMRIAQEKLGNVVLIDVLKGVAQGKAIDLEDAQVLLNSDYSITGSDDIAEIKDSDIVVVTAGLARKPGMTREELLLKNSEILKNICNNIKNYASNAIVIIVTNPLDLMTYLALKLTGFKKQKVFGMGISLDAARFANLISKEVGVLATDVDACVIGSHGEGMIPLAEFSKIKGEKLEKRLSQEKIEELLKRTVNRGAEIVSLLGSGSAFFAPSAAIAQLVKNIVQDQRKVVGVCAWLSGEYGINDVCTGVPARIGRNGIENIVEFKLNENDQNLLIKSAESIRGLAKQLPL
ncbi:MAG: malate dehydrogenase [Candidatus Omnitrophica bacterium]|nr:malate dehydrogenase [Candidatus Omnitrophota bacterium]